MGPFALPVPGYRLGIHSRAHKRRKTDDGEQDEEEIELGPEWDLPPSSSSRLPSDSINPRSYSPDTLHQLAVAGLDPEDDVPSATNRLFPHKPLASGKKRRVRRGTTPDVAESGDDVGTKQADTTAKQRSDRLKHLSTLTAVVHRCLAEGDIARAKRAFGLLVRTKDVDIRLAGFWAVGSEILMRDGEADQQPLDHQRPRRWGTAANTDRVRDYLETLIQQHPHDVHRPHLTSAMDFWPALFGIEIYSLDAEYQNTLRRLRADEEEDGDNDDDMAYGAEEDDDENQYERQQRREAARAQRDELRLDTRDAAARVAHRMDQTMETAAFGANRELLRLHGNLCLYIADLCIPSRLIDEYEDDNSSEELSPRQIEDKLRKRAESADEYDALSRRRVELEKAREFFQKIVDGGGEVDDWVRKFVLGEEDDDAGGHDAGYDDDAW
ncbi:hypothetical protein F4821DRAFT_274098 [Hypoxylon rubiginosum]|uniref:Uncharacterized protein n=1 Tax=Hypoxylon rubiginosum TaxID=110542 RepID=A0ACC0DMB9_9PEZI|nr:hypothetical protein F4821DRAFT_274098 [Hypoxylon rubiginosum]